MEDAMEKYITFERSFVFGGLGLAAFALVFVAGDGDPKKVLDILQFLLSAATTTL